MKKYIVLLLLLSFNVYAEDDEESYCRSRGGYTNCEKGDLIIVGAFNILKYCDFNKRIVTTTLNRVNNNTVNSMTGMGSNNVQGFCYYIGYERKERR